MLSKWIKDSENISRSAKEKFSKNIDRKRVAQENSRCVIFRAQETELVQRSKVWYERVFLCIMTMGEDENEFTDAQGFPGSGRYLFENQGGCIQIQLRLDAQTDATPPSLL